MPADRLTHPRIGHSRKVCALTDFEFRVWDTYRWAADDFGVMPKSAAKLRGDNEALQNQHTETEVADALQRLCDVGIVVEFDHQGGLYVCSLNWNEHQKIEHPRQTHYPGPTAEVFVRMEVKTRNLFRNFHQDWRKSAASRARATRETAKANGKRLTANGSSGLLERFEQFWAEYPRKVGKDAARKEWLRRSPDDVLTVQMITKVREQRASAQWLKDGGEFIPHPRTWLHQGRWTDEDVRLPAGRSPAGNQAITIEERKRAELLRKAHGGCPHEQRCANSGICVRNIVELWREQEQVVSA